MRASNTYKQKHNTSNNQNSNYQIVSHSDKESSELERSVVSSRNPTVIEEEEEDTEGFKEEQKESRRRCWVGICVGTVVGVALIVIILVVVYMVLDYFNKVPSWIVLPTVPLITQKKPQTPSTALDNRANTIPPPPDKVNLTLLCSEPYVAYHSANSCSSICAPGKCCFDKFQQGNCILNNLDTCGLYAPCQMYYSASTTTAATTETSGIDSNQNQTDDSNYNSPTTVVNKTKNYRGICGKNMTNSSILMCDPKMQACASQIDCIGSSNNEKQKAAAALKNNSWSYTQCIWNINNCSNISPH